jgi:hypothetical protein
MRVEVQRMGHPRFSTEEIGRRGQELYDQQIRPRVEKAENLGKILVVDIETGDYEIDEDHWQATHRALLKHPDAALYSVRIGYPTLAEIGGGWGALR